MASVGRVKLADLPLHLTAETTKFLWSLSENLFRPFFALFTVWVAVADTIRVTVSTAMSSFTCWTSVSSAVTGTARTTPRIRIHTGMTRRFILDSPLKHFPTPCHPEIQTEV